MDRKIRDQSKAMLDEESLLAYIQKLSETVWPDGVLSKGAATPVRTAKDKSKTRTEATLMLASLISGGQPALTCALSLSHILTHTHTHAHSLPLSRTHTLSLAHSHTRTLTRRARLTGGDRAVGKRGGPSKCQVSQQATVSGVQQPAVEVSPPYPTDGAWRTDGSCVGKHVDRLHGPGRAGGAGVWG